jgi:hypothetical protein
MPDASSPASNTLLALSANGAHSGVIAAVVALGGIVALFSWIVYRHGPALARAAGIGLWWVGWACGSQGAIGYMAGLVVIGTILWAGGTLWYAKRRGHWPSPISARLLDRYLRPPA